MIALAPQTTKSQSAARRSVAMLTAKGADLASGAKFA